jgi:hypothetical protein
MVPERIDMDLPFSREAFLAVFERCNAAIWPGHVGAYALGALAFALAVRGGPRATRTVPALLAGAWAFVGIAYHLTFFSAVNPAARLFGVAFVLQAVLFGWASFARLVHFGWSHKPRAVLGVLIVAYATVAYPLVGAALGRTWPHTPAFGVAPCPTTIFTWGVLLLARGPVPWPLLVIPAIWSAIGFTAALALGIREDLGLAAAALAGLAVLAWPQRWTRAARA